MMSIYSALDRPELPRDVLSTGLLIGVAGGLAEIAVVCLYSAVTGGDAANIAGHIASAVGLDNASAVVGVVIHMGIAVALGIALSAGLQIFVGRQAHDGAIFLFMIGGLAAIWAINYFVVLPIVSPGFVHLLPYAVALASKLAFGAAAAAAATLRQRQPSKIAG
jgi:hypothetical protein